MQTQIRILGVLMMATLMTMGCAKERSQPGSGSEGEGEGSEGEGEGSEGEGEGHTEGEGEPLDEELLELVIKTTCEQLIKCPLPGPLSAMYGDTVNQCVTKYEALLDGQLLGESFELVSSDKVRIDRDLLERCLGYLADLDCADAARINEEHPECKALDQSGTVELGGACASSGECRNGYCRDGEEGCPGECTAFVPLGENCSGDDECGPDVACLEGAEPFTSVCTTEEPPAGPNEACSEAKPCGYGLFCDPAASKCVELHDRGESCTDDSQCAPRLACDRQAGQCITFTVVEQEGGACAANRQCDLLAGLLCLGDPQAGTGTCQGLPATGEPCLMGFFCGLNDVCLEGTCRAKVAAGGDCTTDEICQTAWCDGGKCKEKVCGG